MAQNKTKQDKIFATKLRSSVPDNVRAIINTISVKPDTVRLYGSWTYKSQLYPSDIDLQEDVIEDLGLEKAVKHFTKEFQKIVKNIEDKKGYYLGDIKVGQDTRYKIDIGKLIYNKKGHVSFKDYKPKYIKEDLKRLHDTNLFDDQEYKNLLSLVTPKPTQDNYEMLYDLLRQHWLLRWTGKEVLQGYKNLAHGEKKYLSDALQDEGLTKIDLWTLVNGRFLEATNLFDFFYRDKRHFLTLNSSPRVTLKDIIKGLKEEVQKYAFSNQFFKPYKMIKRMWSISRLTNNKKIAIPLSAFMRTDIGRLSQITSDIETLIIMLNTIRQPPMSSIKKEIDNFRARFANIYEIPIKEKDIDCTIKKILKKKLSGKAGKKFVIDKLTKLKNYLSSIIKVDTLKFLKSVKLYPPPPEFLPPSRF